MDRFEKSRKTAENIAQQIEAISIRLMAWGYTFDAATFRRVADDLRNNRNRRAAPPARYFQDF